MNGDYAFRCFDIDVVHDWKGLAVTDYTLVVDLASALDSEHEWPPVGALSVGHDGVQLRVTEQDRHGFVDKVGLRLGIDAPQTVPRLQTSFTRWAFKVGEGDAAQFIWMEAVTN